MSLNLSLNDLDATRVEWIKAKARRIAEARGEDTEELAALRSWLTAEVVDRDRTELTDLAMLALDDEPAATALGGLLKDCRAAFRFDNRTIAAAVVPVAARMTQEFGASVTVRAGEGASMRALERAVWRATGALRVVFDDRLYRGGDLIGARPRDIRDHLLALERGEPAQAGLYKSAGLRSEELPQWELVYFLAGVVYEPQARLTLSDPEAVVKTRDLGGAAEAALDQADPVSCTPGVEIEARCLGCYDLNHGIEVGESARRGFELDGVLATIDQGIGILDFYYAVDEARDCIRLLVSSKLQHVEFVWKRFGEFGTEPFRRMLDRAIANRVADPRDIVKVSLDDYRKRAARYGVKWS